MNTTIDTTEIHVWFERDRAHVELRDIATDKTLIEWWDTAVSEAIEDGFLVPGNFHQSAIDYLKGIYR
jgi:hypothetical protein